MQGDSEARTVAELRAMFRDAGDLRPALLLLRNAEALSGVQMPPASRETLQVSCTARSLPHESRLMQRCISTAVDVSAHDFL